MIARVLGALTDHADPAEALRSLIPGLGDAQQGIGIKVNCVNDELPTHPRVVAALVDLLMEAGQPAESILVFDRTDGELAACGFGINTGPGCQVYGSDHPGVGHADEFVTLTDGSVRFSKILSERVQHLINVPVLKNHEMADITLALKNHYGCIDAPDRLHGRNRDCSPGIAELNAQGLIRDRTRLVLVDAMFGSYRSGLGARPDFAPMMVIAATDPVAADALGQEVINQRRQKDGLPALDAVHIREAAGMGLGTADLSSIDRVDSVIAPVTEKPKPWEGKGESGCNTGGRTGGLIGLTMASALLAIASTRSQNQD
jgi:uncharacterized protein (DUF362 family)